jgi:hypothetical protein
MKNLIIGFLIAAGVIFAGWSNGMSMNGVDWGELDKADREEIAKASWLDYRANELISTKINDLTVIGPGKPGPNMLYIKNDKYRVTLKDDLIIINFGQNDAVSVSDLNEDGHFEQIENVIIDEKKNIVEMIDINRDGVVDMIVKNGKPIKLPSTDVKR